ncbi:MAG TPA: hypothetical protein VJV23_06135 [Candidatus Polarisedimenticolia bacterium]|nr:hypothetical protein [Candidatus Polarisedimenticolia bacterium]
MTPRAAIWSVPGLLAAAAVLALPALATQQAPEGATLRPAEPEDTGPLVAPGPEPDLALIYTGGVAGYVEPCG